MIFNKIKMKCKENKEKNQYMDGLRCKNEFII
jgi:hypothetical protein